MRQNDRVRGIVRTSTGRLLLIKRTRANVPPYWVFPGGGVEPTDESLAQALRREVREELGCDANVGPLVYIVERPEKVERELFFLVAVHGADEKARTGEEFAQPGAGGYEYDEFPLVRAELEKRDIKPETVKAWLLANFEHLEAAPDLSVGA